MDYDIGTSRLVSGISEKFYVKVMAPFDRVAKPKITDMYNKH